MAVCSAVLRYRPTSNDGTVAEFESAAPESARITLLRGFRCDFFQCVKWFTTVLYNISMFIIRKARS
jgi:hypothetical protein